MSMALPAGRERTPILDATIGKKLLVLDYDGTLAYLAVDWTAVRRELVQMGRRTGFESSFRPMWNEIARLRQEQGSRALARVFEVLARHEAVGVSGQKPRVEIVEQVRSLASAQGPQLAVFSSNLHKTVATGLHQLGLESIRVIVGADDVDHWKPNPAGLHVLLRRTCLSTHETAFAGDSEVDARAAAAAGVDFIRV